MKSHEEQHRCMNKNAHASSNATINAAFVTITSSACAPFMATDKHGRLESIMILYVTKSCRGYI